MCIFSRPVVEVSGTRIFAREWRGRELLAYGMQLGAAEDLAMILPLPVPPRSSERSVEFFDLSRCPDLFDVLDAGFPRPRAPAPANAPARGAATLPVHEVGEFVASFVPHPDDFARLDARYQLPEAIGAALPQYRDWGFAVFQLRATGEAARAKVHPMAFLFPRRNPRLLHFPTVHVHDGAVHAEAVFDHTIYYQSHRERRDAAWPRLRAACTPRPAVEFVDLVRARGVVDGALPVWRARLQGRHANRDIALL